MNFEETLQSFFDGSLSESDLAEMFHTISVSDEKRAAFVKSTQLRTSFVEDKAVRRLKPELAQKTLRAALGREPAKPIVPIAAAVQSANRAILPAVLFVGLLLGGWLGYSLGRSNEATPILSTSSRAASPLIADQHQSFVPHQIKHALHKEQRGQNKHETHSAFVSAKTNSEMPATRIAALEPEHVVEMVKETKTENHPTELRETLLPAPEAPVAANAFPVAMISNLKSGDSRFEIDLVQGITLAQTRINATNLSAPPVFSMFRLHAGMRLDEQTNVGLLIGQNVFSVRYTEQSDPLTVKTYSQFLSVAYGGMYAERALQPLLGVVPSVSIGAGVSTFGAVGSLEIGASLPIIGTFHAYGGMHGDLLLYKHVGTWFGGETVSVVAGIGAGF